MDIYIAKEHMDKLLTYVSDIADNKPRMYQKSKDRLKDIATTCQRVVEIISEILQEEMLDDCFEHSDDSDIKNEEILDMVKHMQSELLSLKQFVQYTPETEEGPVDLQLVKNDIALVKDRDINLSNISTVDRKSAMSEYKTTLRKMSEKYIEFPQVADLCKLLHRWFETRFYTSMKVSSDVFRYNIRRIPSWISDIVAVYGSHVESDTCNDFIHSFYDWCDDLEVNSSRYAVPYEVYQFDVDTKKHINLTSVVIWDILLDNGLSGLCKPEKAELYLTDELMYNLCMKYSPEQLDDYQNYKVDRSIIEKCKIFSEWSRKEDSSND